MRGAPSLVIQILPPTTAANDRGPKIRADARFGVQEYWIVDPDRKAIAIYRRVQEGYGPTQIFREQETLTSPLLPDFFLPVGAIFQS